MKLFFKLTKFGFINLFYAPLCAYLIFFFVKDIKDIFVLLSICIVGVAIIGCYVLIKTFKHIRKNCFDFLIIAPLAWLSIVCFFNSILISLDRNYIVLMISILTIGALYGLNFAIENFISYSKMKTDYLRIDEMMKIHYNSSIVHNLENGSPCEQSIAKEFKKKYYDKNC